MDVPGCAWGWGREWERFLWLCCWEPVTEIGSSAILSLHSAPFFFSFFLCMCCGELSLQREFVGNSVRSIATPSSPSHLYAFAKCFPLLGCPFHSSSSWEMFFIPQVSTQMSSPPRHRVSIAPPRSHQRPIPSFTFPRSLWPHALSCCFCGSVWVFFTPVTLPSSHCREQFVESLETVSMCPELQGGETSMPEKCIKGQLAFLPFPPTPTPGH